MKATAASVLQIQPWAVQNLPWAKRHYEEGDPRCTCMLCGEVIGTSDHDRNRVKHDPDCAGCAVCEIAIRLWKGEGNNCLEQRYHAECFGKVCRSVPACGPVHP